MNGKREVITEKEAVETLSWLRLLVKSGYFILYTSYFTSYLILQTSNFLPCPLTAAYS